MKKLIEMTASEIYNAGNFKTSERDMLAALMIDACNHNLSEEAETDVLTENADFINFIDKNAFDAMSNEEQEAREIFEYKGNYAHFVDSEFYNNLPEVTRFTEEQAEAISFAC